MPVTARVLLDGLVPEARAAGFTALDRPTDSGLDLYHACGDEVVVTANYAPRYNRVSVKLIIQCSSRPRADSRWYCISMGEGGTAAISIGLRVFSETCAST